MTTSFGARPLLALLVVAMVPLAWGCGGKAKPGEACQTQSDCEKGAICFEHKCEAPNERFTCE